MDYQTLIYETRDNYALISLNRPQRLNAWTWQMAREQLHAIATANDDPQVGAVVMTGIGRGFCAGADIGDVFAETVDKPVDNQDNEDSFAADWVSAVRSAKPLIAAVNGPAVGVGLTMILGFDVIVASEAARFGMFFVKMGATPELASSHFLVQRVGFGRASELCLSARMVAGAEAVELGLADYLVSPEQLLERATDIARQIAANPTPQLLMTKALLTANGSETDLDAVIRREGEVLARATATAEHREAISAFMEKRPADFRKLDPALKS
jgi:enoyl-CoA hydratase/carnithine racemase